MGRQRCQPKTILFFHARRQKLHEADLELQRKREYIEKLEPPTDNNSKWGWGSAVARARGSSECSMELRDLVCSAAARRIEELQDSLQKKDADLQAMEERYRRYVDKARTVRMLGVPLSASGPAPCASHQFTSLGSLYIPALCIQTHCTTPCRIPGFCMVLNCHILCTPVCQGGLQRSCGP